MIYDKIYDLVKVKVKVKVKVTQVKVIRSISDQRRSITDHLAYQKRDSLIVTYQLNSNTNTTSTSSEPYSYTQLLTKLVSTN